MLAIMYLLLIRPQRAKQRAAQEMLNRLAPGDEVLTVGGIYGDVIEVEEDKVVLEIAEDVHIEVSRRAVAQIIQDEPPALTEAGEADEEELDEAAEEPDEVDEEPESAASEDGTTATPEAEAGEAEEVKERAG
jgi:preprotein translocase subunit YajC